MFWVEHQKTAITYHMKTKPLRSVTIYFGEERLGFSHKEVGTHSIWSGFYMELYLYKLYPETIMIMERWISSDLMRYIRIQVSDLSKDISTLMANKQDFYTIPEIEVVYHTPGHYNTEPKRMNLNIRGQ